MGTKQALKLRRTGPVAWLFAVVLVLSPALVHAQDAAPSPETQQAAPSPATQQEGTGFFATFGRWFSQQSSNVNSTFKDARQKVEGLGQDAGTAAKSTVEGAKDAAGAVARIPTMRTVSGHEKCQVAPNGAPDCVAAANAICTAKGFDSGRSLDMTTAEICPPKVWMAGQSTGPECRTETFVSRAVCQ